MEKTSATKSRTFQTYINRSVPTWGIVREYHRKRHGSGVAHQLKQVVFKGDNHK